MWWQRLDWATLLRASQQTYVQVPDRLRGAYTTARGKLLEVLDKADAAGDSEAKWKALLAFDLLLLGNSRATTCAEKLEEQLPLWWGGQWDALWTALVRTTPPPPTASAHTLATERQKAKRVHTLAAAG